MKIFSQNRKFSAEGREQITLNEQLVKSFYAALIPICFSYISAYYWLLMLRFQKTYFLIALFLFLLLVFIAMYVKDAFIRPYGGDLLVVIFLYCLVRSFFRIPVKKAIFGVLLFAFLIESLQYLQLIRHLELENNAVAVAVLGSHFEWLDLLLYSVGALLVFGTETMMEISSKRN